MTVRRRYRARLQALLAGLMLVVVLTGGVPGAGATVLQPYGLAPVRLLTPQHGGGVHPVLAWKRVPGAATYRVVVRNAARRPYWTWVGTPTRVTVSAAGRAVPKSLPVGPRIGKNFSWSVAAYDGTGKPLALSRQRAISP